MSPRLRGDMNVLTKLSGSNYGTSTWESLHAYLHGLLVINMKTIINYMFRAAQHKTAKVLPSCPY